jgi:hypothetical protein
VDGEGIGNSLRELDRFLSVLIDEVAAAIEPTGLDRAAFSQQRNTANKLRTIRTAMALPSPDDQRLRAIGRDRDCLFHCAEIRRYGDRRTRREAAMLPRRIAHAERLIPDTAQLSDYCRLYDRIVADLLAACAEHLRTR